MTPKPKRPTKKLALPKLSLGSKLTAMRAAGAFRGPKPSRKTYGAGCD